MKVNLSVIAIMSTIGIVKACDLPPNTSALASKDATIGEKYCNFPEERQVFVEFAIGKALAQGESFMENCFGSILRSLLEYSHVPKQKCAKGEQKMRPFVIRENNGELSVEFWHIPTLICVTKSCGYELSNEYLKSVFIEASKVWWHDLQGTVEDQFLLTPKCARRFIRDKYADVCLKRAEPCDFVSFLRFNRQNSNSDDSFTAPFCHDGCHDGKYPISLKVFDTIWEVAYGQKDDSEICLAEGDVLTVERTNEEGDFDLESHCTNKKREERTFCKDVPKRRALKKILENNIQ